MYSFLGRSSDELEDILQKMPESSAAREALARFRTEVRKKKQMYTLSVQEEEELSPRKRRRGI